MADMEGALRRLREERRLTPRQVADELCISERTVYRHEDPAAHLSGLVLRGWADYYGVEWRDLV